MIRVALNHKTAYRFDRLVNVGPHIVRLRPAPHTRTPVESYSLDVGPGEHFLNWQQDPYGNWMARLVFEERMRELTIDVELIVDMTVINPFDFFIDEYAETFPFAYEPELEAELGPYLRVSEPGSHLGEWLTGVDRSEQKTVDFLVAINQRLASDIAYTVRMAPGVQTPEETLHRKIGSRRDTAWLFVNALRSLGLAARFVSGYLIQLTADVKSLDGPSGPEADFTDLHAWAETYIPGAGWVGLDATSGLFAGEGHIPLAATASPGAAAPITGVTEPCEVEFEFSNSVVRIHEDPRVTKPYSDAQWERIDRLGHEVDAALDAGDVKLTLGGEPTFVSVDDMDGDQWNYAPDGAEKRALARALTLKLKDRFGRDGLLLYGQGKWYPGESLPRWLMGIYWRTDGAKTWGNPNLLADPEKDYGATVDDARRFAYDFVDQLGIDPDYVVPGFEDSFYYLWREQQVPENLDPLDARSGVAEDDVDSTYARERKHLAGVMARGLANPVGFVIPLRWDRAHQGWQTAAWRFRSGKMVLVPGDSPMGYRMPLDQLPWEEQPDPALDAGRDQFDDSDDLVDNPGDAEHAPPKVVTKAIPHTAIGFEPRNGRMHVFMPPVKGLEQYLELTSIVERIADRSDMPVVIEGYEPPRDPRLQRLLVTPDPGVIEVNIHPVTNWEELVDNTIDLYEIARDTRLGTEKFMLDGRHTGTGGGNHLTFGAANAADSPVLRRPDLLQSLITYWQHHPAMSYLFSGLYIGPTSQAPRVDEARHESLYDLEIAFSQLPKGGEVVKNRWLVDRALRNLLVDLTGNTHRAEFCIDKLYTPTEGAGRLGLVEVRSFEMPPHAKMSLVQALMLRALIAWFWNSRTTSLSFVGAPNSTTVFFCRIMSSATSVKSRPTCAAAATTSSRSGSTRSSSFGSPSSARCTRATSRSNFAPRSSRGTCSAKKSRPRARLGRSTLRWSACRSRFQD